MAALRRLIPAAQPVARRRLGFIDSRAYGSASAAQLQYDYDYEEYSEGSIPGRGVQWVIMGDPLAKKQVYGERLSKLLRVPHISMGSLVRQELHPQSSLYKQISNAVNQGKLVPEDIIFSLLSKRLEEGYSKGETGFILDGIPRTRIQADILDQIADIDFSCEFQMLRGMLVEACEKRNIFYWSRISEHGIFRC